VKIEDSGLRPDTLLQKYNVVPIEYIVTPGTTFIYVLIDPVSNDVRYVGKSNNPNRRLMVHCWHEMDCRATHKSRWIAILKKNDMYPILYVIDSCKEDWKVKEKYWVDYFLSKGAPLTNIASGGNGGPIAVGDDVREKMRIANIGKHHTEDACQRISESRKGMKFPEIHKERLSAKKTEYFKDPANRARLSRYWAVITDEQAREIYRLANEGRVTQREIGKQFGIPASSVSEIKYKKRYAHAFIGTCEDL
jgi:hypothetical protein